MKTINQAEKIKSEINKRGIKSKFLAKKLGVSEAMFSYLLSGQRRWQPYLVDRLCLELELDKNEVEE